MDSYSSLIEYDIYADKSALVLEWLLTIGIQKKDFSIREVSRDRGVSLGLVHKIFKELVLKGYLVTKGFKTAKQFSVKKAPEILKDWMDHYAIVRKCKLRTYRSLFDKDHAKFVLEQSQYGKEVVLALHSSAEAYGIKNSNLETLELYLMKPKNRIEIESLLKLEPQEKGYEVLLIEPYYKSLLSFYIQQGKGKKIFSSPALLTFLDLYHFPLRGHEQAEFMADRIEEIKRIYKG